VLHVVQMLKNRSLSGLRFFLVSQVCTHFHFRSTI
jgi:hypothetical protein